MLLAETTTWQMVWMSGIAAALVLTPVVLNALVTIFTAYFQSRSLNASSKVRSDAVVAKVDQQSERIEEHVERKITETASQAIGQAVLAAKEINKDAIATKDIPQKMEVVNTEPIPVMETEAKKK